MLASSHMRETSKAGLSFATFYQRASVAAGVTVTIVGTLVLVGWWLHTETAKIWLPDLVTMMFNVALCFLLTGFALCTLQMERPARVGAYTCALPVCAVAMLTLFEYRFGWNVGIDEFAVLDPAALAH
jgi:uncharacterized membrane protein YkgB